MLRPFQVGGQMPVHPTEAAPDCARLYQTAEIMQLRTTLAARELRLGSSGDLNWLVTPSRRIRCVEITGLILRGV